MGSGVGAVRGEPAGLPRLPDLLDKARPVDGALFALGGSERLEVYPSANAEAEQELHAALSTVAGGSINDAASAVRRLEREHAPRRDWVWASLGLSPLAKAMEHLAAVVDLCAEPVSGSTTDQTATWYADVGWRVDDQALRAIAASRSVSDRDAVLSVLHEIYTPWLDGLAERFQEQATTTGYIGATGIDAPSGTCVVFVDGLRYDVGCRLLGTLSGRGVSTQMSHRLAAFPTVTATGQPAVAPLPGAGPGPGFAAGDGQGRALVGEGLRRMLT